MPLHILKAQLFQESVMKGKQVVPNRFLLVYASQTGQAKAISEEIANAAPSFGFLCDLYNLSLTEKRFNIEAEKCVVFVVSTSGDGEPPDDAVKFFRRLSRRTLKNDYLKVVNYALLALGDSNYIKFCNFGFQLEKVLISLSAKCFYPTGYGDDAFGIETGVDPWISNLWPALRKQLGLENSTEFAIDANCTDYNITNDKKIYCPSLLVKSMDTEGSTIFTLPSLLKDIDLDKLKMPRVPEPSLQVSFSEKGTVDVKSYVPNDSLLVSPSSPLFKASFVHARKLTNSSDVKKTLELKFKFENENVLYAPGDSFGFICSNPKEDVTVLLKRLNVIDVADVPCKILIHEGSSSKRSLPKHIPTFLSLREIFSSCIEMRSVPKKVLLRIFAEYAENSDKFCLQFLCSQEGSKFYTDFVRKPSLGVLDILDLFKTCTPPVGTLIEYLPALRPRFYSVASSPLVDRKLFTVVFSVLQLPKSEGRRDDREGVCTGWLNRLSSGLQLASEGQNDELECSLSQLSLENNEIITIYKRKNDRFIFPKNLDVPVIMVGPGVGVSPFVGFLQHREKQMQAADPNAVFGETWLFCGCRYESKDFLFKEELKRWKSSQVLSHLIVSFSRDENCSSTKYVHESIRQFAGNITEAIKLGGKIYVCGDAKHMAQDVMQAFVDVFKIGFDLTVEEAKKFVDQLQQDCRYLSDVWT